MHLKQNNLTRFKKKGRAFLLQAYIWKLYTIIWIWILFEIFKIVLNYLSSFFNIVYRCKAVESKYGKQKEQTRSFWKL